MWKATGSSEIWYMFSAAFAVLACTVLGAYLYVAHATVPLAARLLAEPYATTGVRVNIANLGSQMRGLANDGNTVYAMNQSGMIYTVDLSMINMSEGQTQQDVNGVAHTVGWGVNGAPSLPGSIEQLSLAYSHGCLFITNDDNTTGNTRLYCIDVSDWSVTEVAVPGAQPLPAGYYFIQSSLVDFPDGRIGKVSGYTQTGPAMHESTLRTYQLTGTGKNVSLAFSQDYTMQDDSTIYSDAPGWARDEHGIATDGTYLYRIQWNSITPNTKVWALDGSAPSQVVYEGSYTQPFSNMHYLSHNHKDNYYLMGHFWGTEFFMTRAANPGPGPGNPLMPTFAAHTPLSHGFTVQITNYDPSFTWSIASSSAPATISSTGLVTVTGLNPGQSATFTVVAQKTGVPNGSAGTSGAALGEDSDGDGTADSGQLNVRSTTNPETGKAVALSVASSAACSLSSLSTHSAAQLAADPGYSYPLGLLGFQASCGNVGFTATIKQYYYSPTAPASSYIARKYINGAYRTVPGATLATQTINGAQVLVITYQVTDGGSLDDDGVANGVIVDPAGPALVTASTPGAPNTGVGRVASMIRSGVTTSLVAPLVAAILIAGGICGTALIVRRRR